MTLEIKEIAIKSSMYEFSVKATVCNANPSTPMYFKKCAIFTGAIAEGKSVETENVGAVKMNKCEK